MAKHKGNHGCLNANFAIVFVFLFVFRKICQHIELVNDLLLLVIYHLYYNICHKIRLASRPSTCLNLHVVQNRQKKQIPSFNNLE